MCGVAGAWQVNQPLDAMRKLMSSLQYRGEQGAGIAAIDQNGKFLYERETGVVPRLFMKRVEGMDSENFDPTHIKAAITHLRYGTAGTRKAVKNIQPFYASTSHGEIYIAHNGDTPNFTKHRNFLCEKGAVFSSDSDTEFILHFISLAKAENIIEAVKLGLRSYQGTFALTMLVKGEDGVKMIAARDHSGNRPLVLGRWADGFVVASESQAFEAVNASFVREVESGEMIIFSEDGIREEKLYPNSSRKGLCQCDYELTYFGFPTSKLFGVHVADFREELGRKMAIRFGGLVRENDVIVNIPDSSNFFADGFCKSTRFYPERVLTRRHSIDMIRSFTQESAERRDEAVREKFSFDSRKIAGRRVWMLDDSIVRGTTSRRLVRMFRSGGATWVGVLLSCPTIRGDCGKGIDFSSDLIADLASLYEKNIEEYIRAYIGADFIGFQTIDDYKDALKAVGANTNDFCFGCFEGSEPIWKVW